MRFLSRIRKYLTRPGYFVRLMNRFDNWCVPKEYQ